MFDRIKEWIYWNFTMDDEIGGQRVGAIVDYNDTEGYFIRIPNLWRKTEKLRHTTYTVIMTLLVTYFTSVKEKEIVVKTVLSRDLMHGMRSQMKLEDLAGTYLWTDSLKVKPMSWKVLYSKSTDGN